MVEGNEEKLVEAGAVEHYVTLLTDTRQYDESIQREAAHGLFMMAFKCPQNILNERRSLDGLSLCMSLCVVINVMTVTEAAQHSPCHDKLSLNQSINQ